MASWDDFTGWGGLMQPASPQQQQQPGVLSDPAMQAALLSFGLQAMSGGWGNGLQQTAQALGAGAQGAGAYTQHARQRQVEDQAIADRQAERADRRESGEAQRRTQLDVANIGAASRQEIAALHADARLQRVDDRMAISQLQARQRAEAAALAAYTRQLQGHTTDMSLMGNAAARAAADARAHQAYMAEMERVQRLYGGGAPAGAPAADAPQPGGLNPVNPPVLNRPAAPSPAAPPPAANPPPAAAPPIIPGAPGPGVNIPPGPQPLGAPRRQTVAPPNPATVQRIIGLRDQAASGNVQARQTLEQLLANPTLGPQVRSILGQ